MQGDDKRGYLVHSLTPLPPGAIATRIFEPHEGLPGRVMREGWPLIVTDLLGAAASRCSARCCSRAAAA